MISLRIHRCESVARIDDGVSPRREFREGGSGKHHRGEAQSSTQPCHATGNVSNFLWLLCIPMNGEGLGEKQKGREWEWGSEVSARGKIGGGKKEREKQAVVDPIRWLWGYRGYAWHHSRHINYRKSYKASISPSPIPSLYVQFVAHTPLDGISSRNGSLLRFHISIDLIDNTIFI